MISRAYPVPEVIARLSPRERGELLGRWFALMRGAAGILARIWDPAVDRSEMIVRRGMDSSTWNTVAQAYNNARAGWLSAIAASGAEEIRATVKRVGTSWRCLADQSALTVMPPELTPIISELNHWALEHGMERTARVVKRSAISEMQARRIIREGGLVQNAGIYDTRDEAWRALTEEQGAKSTGS